MKPLPVTEERPLASSGRGNPYTVAWARGHVCEIMRKDGREVMTSATNGDGKELC